MRRILEYFRVSKCNKWMRFYTAQPQGRGRAAFSLPSCAQWFSHNLLHQTELTPPQMMATSSFQVPTPAETMDNFKSSMTHHFFSQMFSVTPPWHLSLWPANCPRNLLQSLHNVTLRIVWKLSVIWGFRSSGAHVLILDSQLYLLSFEMLVQFPSHTLFSCGTFPFKFSKVLGS